MIQPGDFVQFTPEYVRTMRRRYGMSDCDAFRGHVVRLTADGALITWSHQTAMSTEDPECLVKITTEPMTQEDFILQSGLVCPYCRAKDPMSHGWDFDDVEVTSLSECESCKKKWLEVYELSGYRRIDDDDERFK